MGRAEVQRFEHRAGNPEVAGLESGLLAPDKKAFYPHDFQDALDGLSDDLVNDAAYNDATSAAGDAMPADSTERDALYDNVADVWIGHARKYANLVPGRLAKQLAETATEAESDGLTADQIAARIDAKIEAQRYSITRYAEPTWGAGNQAYGDALSANDVLLVWQLGADEDHCDDCLGLADGSPYPKGALTTWPKLGDTQCFDKCYCAIVADDDSWNQAFGGGDANL